MATHPSGITVEIVGIAASDSGRSCDEHDVCGSVLAEDVVVRFRKVQIIRACKEETAIAVYWVSDGIDRCRVGFLQRHLVKHWKQYDGLLAQVIEIYGQDAESPTKRKKFHHNKGCCVAAVISHVSDENTGKILQQKRAVELCDNDDDTGSSSNTANKKSRT